MAPYSDPDIDSLMERYFNSDKDPRFLYRGSYAQTVKKLRAWVPRRMEHNQNLMVAREKSHAASDAMLAFSRGDCSGPAPPTVAETIKHMNYVNELDKETDLDNMRAMYLLDALRHRGVTWPEVGFMPEFAGGVCSFLGTIDSTFDVKATLIILEDKEHEEFLLAKRAEIAAYSADADFLRGKSATKAPAKPAEGVDQVPDEEKREDRATNNTRAQQRKKAIAKARRGTFEPEVVGEASESAEILAEAKEAFEPEAEAEASKSAEKSAEAEEVFETWAKEALDQNQYPGVIFLKGKIVAMGVNKDEAHKRLDNFAKAELGAGVSMEDVVVRTGFAGDAVALIYTHYIAGDTESSTDDGSTLASASTRPPSPTPQQASKKDWVREILAMSVLFGLLCIASWATT